VHGMSVEPSELVLRGLLGRGRHGSVWRAERRGTPGRVVAVKLLALAPADGPGRHRAKIGPIGPIGPQGSATHDASHRATSSADTVPAAGRRVQELERVADTLRRLSDAALLPIEEIAVVRGHLALVLPFVAGGSLDDLLSGQSDRTVDDRTVARWGAELFDALGTGHDAGLVHGSISAQDVLFDSAGGLLLSGMGLTEALLQANASARRRPAEARQGDVEALGKLMAGLLSDPIGPPDERLAAILRPTGGDRGGRHTRTERGDERPGAPAREVATLLRAWYRDATPHRADAATTSAAPSREGRASGVHALIGGTDHRDRTAPTSSAAAQAGLKARTRRTHGRRSRRIRPRVHRAPTDRRGRQRSPLARHHPARAAWPLAILMVALLVILTAGEPVLRPGPEPDPSRATATASPDHQGTGLAIADATTVPPSGGGAAPRRSEPRPDARPPAPATDRSPRSPPPLCEGFRAPPADRDGRNHVIIDATGQGCGKPLHLARDRLRLSERHGGTQHFQLVGIPAQAVLLAGDWNCDGSEGIALYLPASGETLRYDHLPRAGGAMRSVAEPSGVLDGRPSVWVDEDGCAEVVVQPS
jgi:hypothetical protein